MVWVSLLIYVTEEGNEHFPAAHAAPSTTFSGDCPHRICQQHDLPGGGNNILVGAIGSRGVLNAFTPALSTSCYLRWDHPGSMSEWARCTLPRVDKRWNRMDTRLNDL